MTIRDVPFNIWGGGLEKNSLSPQKSEKKSLLKMWAEKKNCCVNLWKICWPEKTPNGNLHNRESIRQNISSAKHKKKNCRTLIAKKMLFSLGGEKKRLQAKNSNHPPPPRYIMVRPLRASDSTLSGVAIAPLVIIMYDTALWSRDLRPSTGTDMTSEVTWMSWISWLWGACAGGCHDLILLMVRSPRKCKDEQKP